MKIKKLFNLGAALIVALYSLFAINLNHAFAVANNCTWLGTNGNIFSDASNWNNCNSTFPQTGDNLIFDDSSNGVGGAALNNDIASLSVGDITFQGTSPYGFNISGNGISVAGNITDNTTAQNTFNTTLTFTNNSTITDSSVASNMIIGGALNFGAHTLTLNVASSINISGGPVTGSGLITANGAGFVLLHADTTNLTSNINVQSGIFEGPSFGSGTITVADGASLIIDSNDVVINVPNAINVSGAGKTIPSGPESTYGAIAVSDIVSPPSFAQVNLTGPITLGSDVQVGSMGVGGLLTISGALSGAHTITTVSQSGLQLVVNSSNNSSKTSNGTQDISYQTTTIGSSDSLPSAAVEVDFGQLVTIDGVRGDTTVFKNGILKGSGTVGILAVQNGGVVAPGHSPGCLNTGNLTINGTYEAEIGGTTTCSGYDQLNVTGTVNVTGGTLSTSLYNNYKPAAGESYSIIKNDGSDAVSGTFTNLPEGATFTVGGYVFQITYKGGDGNDVVLTVKSVPAAPNTGFGLISAHPVIELFSAGLMASGFYGLSRTAIARRR